MLTPFVFTIVPLILIIIGFLILWWMYSRPGTTQLVNAVWLTFGKAFGWLVLLLGVFAAVGLLTNVFFVIAWLLTAIILVSTAAKYRDTERESLLWALMVAAERGIPLESAARAFAEERNDLVGLRARLLAEYLEAGVPLALSLQRTHYRLAPPALLAADLGQQTGQLAAALRQVVTQTDDFESSFRSMLEKVFYLGFLVFFNLCLLTFMMLKIVPVFEKMFSEFDLRLPVMTQALIHFSWLLANYWFLFAPIFLVVIYLFTASVLYYMGLLPQRLPLLRSLWWRIDSAWVLRWLATGVRQKRPLAEMVRLLAGYFPQARMRAKLAWVAGRIDHGAEWTDALKQAGIISGAERSVFKSAERVGNLEWALEEMADSGTRRMAHRLQAYVSVGFPLVIALFGLGVLAFQVGMFLPLISLIQVLT